MQLRPRSVIAVAFIISFVVGFFVASRYLIRAMIGLDPSAFPAGDFLQSIGKALAPGAMVAMPGLLLAVGVLLLVAVLTFAAVLSSVRGGSPVASGDRRSFLAGSVAGVGAAAGAVVVGGAGMLARSMLGVGNGGRGWAPVAGEIFSAQVVKTHPEWKQEWKGSRVQAFGRLGRTQWPVSDTVLGTGPLRGEKGEQIVRLALERGINYIDTAPDYSASGSEQAVGRAIRGVQRDSFFLATKFCTAVGHLGPGTPVERYKQVVEDSLRRLGTDYVDLVHIHSCDEIDRLLDDNVHEAFGRLKQEGKARFIGFSSHTPNLVPVANAAIDSGRFDVMMLAYHHGIWPQLDAVIERARSEQDMGVVAMKTLKGARQRNLEGFQGEADSYAQAALRWVHSNPNVSCAVISFFELQHIDEYLHASGQVSSAADLAVLEKYDRLVRGSYCAPHCGACLGACPEQLAINDVLRHRMYFEDYRSEQQAVQLYAQLERNASVCVSCSAPCAGSCPLDIPIRERMIGAHELLVS